MTHLEPTTKFIDWARFLEAGPTTLNGVSTIKKIILTFFVGIIAFCLLGCSSQGPVHSAIQEIYDGFESHSLLSNGYAKSVVTVKVQFPEGTRPVWSVRPNENNWSISYILNTPSEKENKRDVAGFVYILKQDKDIPESRKDEYYQMTRDNLWFPTVSEMIDRIKEVEEEPITFEEYNIVGYSGTLAKYKSNKRAESEPHDIWSIFFSNNSRNKDDYVGVEIILDLKYIGEENAQKILSSIEITEE